VPNSNEEDKEDEELADAPWTAEACKEQMLLVNQYVSEVS